MRSLEDAKKKVFEIAEDLNTTPFDLRLMAIDDCYNVGCLTHEDYVFLIAWAKAEERLHAIDTDIVELKDYFERRLRGRQNMSSCDSVR